MVLVARRTEPVSVTVAPGVVDESIDSDGLHDRMSDLVCRWMLPVEDSDETTEGFANRVPCKDTVGRLDFVAVLVEPADIVGYIP